MRVPAAGCRLLAGLQRPPTKLTLFRHPFTVCSCGGWHLPCRYRRFNHAFEALSQLEALGLRTPAFVIAGELRWLTGHLCCVRCVCCAPVVAYRLTVC